MARDAKKKNGKKTTAKTNPCFQKTKQIFNANKHDKKIS